MEDEAAGLAALPVDALDDVVDLFADAEQPPVALRAHAADHEEVAVGIADEIGIDWGAKVERAPEQREVPEAAFQRGLFVHLVLADHRGHQLDRSEEHTSELQTLMRTSYAGFYLQK